MIDKSTRQHYESQGGMKNYLGEQEMVEAPKYWKSRPDKPETELAYITKAEKDLIMKSDLHGSLNPNVKGKFAPNEGPSGIISLDYQGDKDNYGKAGTSFGDKETYTSTSVSGGNPHRDNTKVTVGPSTPKDHFDQSWSGPKGWFGGGGYRDLNVAGDTSQGHKSRFNPMGILGLLMGIPGLGFLAGGLKDFSKHNTLADWWGNRSTWNEDPNDISKYGDAHPTNRLNAINTDFYDQALTSDRFSDMKLPGWNETQNTGILSNANKYTNNIGPNNIGSNNIDRTNTDDGNIMGIQREKTLEEIARENDRYDKYNKWYGGA